MPVTLEQLHSQITNISAQLAHIEYLSQQEPVKIGELLNTINNVLIDISAISIIFGQVEHLSGKRIALMEQHYDKIQNFFVRLLPIVTRYHTSREHRQVIMQITENLPPQGEEEKYIRTLAFSKDRMSIIPNRIYVPQAFVGIMNVHAIEDSIAEVAFLATAGLGPCVGYILFSKTAKCCALAHFDDLLNATATKASDELKEKAIQHYRICAQRILEEISKFSEAAVAKDWQVILTPSASSLSRALQQLLGQAVARVENITATHVSRPKIGDEARNVLIELDGFLTEPAQLRLHGYEEVVQFADLPANLLTLREALHLPARGFRLYHIGEGSLTLQDINGLFTMIDNYVTPRPLAAGVAAITDRVAAEPPPGGASAAAAAEITAEPAIDDAAEPQQPPEVASSSASGVRRPVLMSRAAVTAVRPDKRERSVERAVDGYTAQADDDIPDSEGAARDRPDGEPPPKRPRPGGGASND